MTLKSPQSDLPRALSGAADLWDVEQAGVLLTAEFLAAPDGTLAGAGAVSANTSTAGAVTQTHKLAGANAAQQNTSTSAAVIQVHVLTGADVIQVNTSKYAAIPGYLYAQAEKKCELQASTILRNSLAASSAKLATLTTKVINHV